MKENFWYFLMIIICDLMLILMTFWLCRINIDNDIISFLITFGLTVIYMLTGKPKRYKGYTFWLS